jgi:hypothetical protein
VKEAPSDEHDQAEVGANEVIASLGVAVGIGTGLDPNMLHYLINALETT